MDFWNTGRYKDGRFINLDGSKQKLKLETCGFLILWVLSEFRLELVLAGVLLQILFGLQINPVLS